MQIPGAVTGTIPGYLGRDLAHMLNMQRKTKTLTGQEQKKLKH